MGFVTHHEPMTSCLQIAEDADDADSWWSVCKVKNCKARELGKVLLVAMSMKKSRDRGDDLSLIHHSIKLNGLQWA
jgi:hypothetical protein